MKITIPTTSTKLIDILTPSQTETIRKKRNDIHHPALVIEVSDDIWWTIIDDDAVVGENISIKKGHKGIISIENGLQEINHLKFIAESETTVNLEIISLYSSSQDNSPTEEKQDDIVDAINSQGSLSTPKTSTVTLTTAGTAYKLPSSEQTDRRSIIIYNASDTDIYYGDSNVTTTNGILLASGAEVSLDISSGLYAVCGEDNKTINILELK